MNLAGPPTFEDLRNISTQSFKNDGCLYPAADTPCKERVIQSHTVPRQASLRKIAVDGHVLSFHVQMTASGRPITVRRIGIGKASTFTGFCATHDASIFAPIEMEDIQPTPEQALLLAFRPLTREAFAKHAALRATTTAMDRASAVSDPNLVWMGKPLFDDIKKGQELGVADHESALPAYQHALLKRDYEDVNFYAVHTSEIPTVMGSVSVQPEIDFSGDTITGPGSLLDLSIPSQLVALNILANSIGGLIIFSWIGHSPPTEQLVRSFARLPDDQVTDAAIRYLFEFSENIFWSEQWWESLGSEAQNRLRDRFSYTCHPWNVRLASALVDDGLRLGDWGVRARVTSLLTDVQG